jgi:hypothetical protein
MIASLSSLVTAAEVAKIEDVIVIYKCESKTVIITNIDQVSSESIVDQDNVTVSGIRTGSTILYISGDRIKLEKVDQDKFMELVRKRANWKVIANGSSVDSPVGLEQDSTDILFFMENEWWLIRAFPQSIGMVGVELILDKNDVKVATLKQGAEIIKTDEVDLMKILSKM